MFPAGKKNRIRMADKNNLPSQSASPEAHVLKTTGRNLSGQNAFLVSISKRAKGKFSEEMAILDINVGKG